MEGDSRKALLIIASRDFRDEEYFGTKRELEKEGISVTTASRRGGEVTGKMGGKATAELGLEEVKLTEYDAVVFIGGPGAREYFDDMKAQSLALHAHESGKLVAAICIAPVILANAGVLSGRKATSWNGDFAEMVRKGGAEHTGEEVTVDGRVITANGPGAAPRFGSAIAKALKDEGDVN